MVMARRALLVCAVYVYVCLAAEEDDTACIQLRSDFGGASGNRALLVDLSDKEDDVAGNGDAVQGFEGERRQLLQVVSHAAEVAVSTATNWTEEIAALAEGLPTREISVGYKFYFMSAALVANAIVLIYGNRGTAVVMGILIYLAANSTVKLAVKWVFLTSHFTFPLFLTALHFASGALASAGVLLFRAQAGTATFPRPNHSEFCNMLLPIAISVVVSIGAGNEALSLSSAAFTEVISATGCLITVAIVILMGLPFKMHLILPTALVTAGCAVSVVGEIHFSLLGFFCCFLANIARSMKVALQQNLMTGEARSKYGPVPLLFWTCLPSSLVMLVSSLAIEGIDPYLHMYSAKWQVFLIPVLVSCIVATVLNLAQIIVTKDLGAVGSQLVAQAKTVLTVLGSVAVFGEHVTLVEALGFASVLLGVFLYSRWDKDDKKACEATPMCLAPDGSSPK